MNGLQEYCGNSDTKDDARALSMAKLNLFTGSWQAGV